MQVIYNRETDRSRGFGFVTMSTVEEAEKAVDTFNRYVSFSRYDSATFVYHEWNLIFIFTSQWKHLLPYLSLHLTISFYSEEFKWTGFHESEDLLV